MFLLQHFCPQLFCLLQYMNGIWNVMAGNCPWSKTTGSLRKGSSPDVWGDWRTWKKKHLLSEAILGIKLLIFCQGERGAVTGDVEWEKVIYFTNSFQPGLISISSLLPHFKGTWCLHVLTLEFSPHPTTSCWLSPFPIASLGFGFLVSFKSINTHPSAF